MDGPSCDLQLPEPACHHCRQTLPPRSVRCPHCGELQSAAALRRGLRDRVADTVFATLLLYATYQVLMRLFVATISAENWPWWLLVVLVVWGIPGSVVAVRGRRLWQTSVADYSVLWRVYWQTQLIVLGIVLALTVLVWFIAVAYMSI